MSRRAGSLTPVTGVALFCFARNTCPQVKSPSFFTAIATDAGRFMDEVWRQVAEMDRAHVDLDALRERHSSVVCADVERARALQEVHGLLQEMAEVSHRPSLP